MLPLGMTQNGGRPAVKHGAVLKMTAGETDNCGLAVGQKLMREVF